MSYSLKYDAFSAEWQCGEIRNGVLIIEEYKIKLVIAILQFLQLHSVSSCNLIQSCAF